MATQFPSRELFQIALTKVIETLQEELGLTDEETDQIIFEPFFSNSEVVNHPGATSWKTIHKRLLEMAGEPDHVGPQ